MKKIYTTLIAVIVIFQFSYAQWTSGAGISTTSDNVGIGTSSPFALLHVAGTRGAPGLSTAVSLIGGGNTYLFTGVEANAPWDIWMQAMSYTGQILPIALQPLGGNVGIGTTNPENKLHLQNGSLVVKTVRQSNNGEFPLVYGTQHVNGVWGYAGVYLYEDGSGGFGQASGLSFKTSVNDVNPVTSMIIRGNGNIGIGTINPDQKLTVNGTIHSREIKVDNSIPVPDYVFEPTYKPLDLSKLKVYLAANHHLPEIPSATEIEKDGLNLGDMNLKLLKKVEELTLYMIELQKQNKATQQQNTELRKELIKTKRRNHLK